MPKSHKKGKKLDIRIKSSKFCGPKFLEVIRRSNIYFHFSRRKHATDQNLYQLIGISETASLQEIETAAVKKYNEARNLVNHHTPEIANNASQELTRLKRRERFS